MVGKVLEEQLQVPLHLLRVTVHHPESFFVYFELPALQDNAVAKRFIMVDGTHFDIHPWHEDDHAALLNYTLHVYVVFERLPMQFWSLDGAEVALGKFCRVDRLDSRAHEREHTKTFA